MSLRIALIQTNLIIGDIDGNLEKLLHQINLAAKQQADLAICSELSLIGYPPRDLLKNSEFIQHNLSALKLFASRAPIPSIIGFAHPCKNTPWLENAAAFVCDKQIKSIHAKTLLPTYDVFDETRYFKPSSQLTLASLDDIALGICICEDAWGDGVTYNQNPITDLATLGADIIINLSASPFSLSKRVSRKNIFTQHAQKQKKPLLVVNQVGGNDELIFDGASLAIDAQGSIIAQGHEFKEDLILVDIKSDGTVIPITQKKPISTSTITALHQGLILGIKDYVHKCNFNSIILGLSGGIDSAVTVCLAQEALGAHQILGIAMPSQYSLKSSTDDAQNLANHLNIDFRIIPIQDNVGHLLSALNPHFDDHAPDSTEENIQARLRSIILMALSNKLGHLLLTTGNKSELAVGYCTLYGDMSGGFAPLSDVSKTMVYELAHEINKTNPVIPLSIINKPPSAELRHNQTDQEFLPPYDILDNIMMLHVEQNMNVQDIVQQGFDQETVIHVLTLIRNSEYKRKQTAPGIKISDKAFGSGRRMPIAQRYHRL